MRPLLRVIERNPLIVAQSQGDDHEAARGELIEKLLRNGFRSGGDDNPLELPEFRPAARAVARNRRDVGEAELR